MQLTFRIGLIQWSNTAVIPNWSNTADVPNWSNTADVPNWSITTGFGGRVPESVGWTVSPASVGMHVLMVKAQNIRGEQLHLCLFVFQALDTKTT